MVDSNGKKVVKSATAWAWGVISTVVAGVAIFIITTSLSGNHDDHELLMKTSNLSEQNKDGIEVVQQQLENKLNKEVFQSEVENLKKSIEKIDRRQEVIQDDIKEILKTVRK